MENFSPILVCSDTCSAAITDIKKNMSVFFDQIGFRTPPAGLTTSETGNTIEWNGFTIRFMETPGHTNGSICIFAGNEIFTGDTIIYRTKTIVKFPGGSRDRLKSSFYEITSAAAGKGLYVRPGHGDGFYFDDINLDELL
jgi:hydroxyacylglutathione hydrolase